MSKSLSVLLLSIALLAQFAVPGMTGAAPIVLDFEDLDPGPGVEANMMLPANYHGFVWSKDAAAMTKNYVPSSGYEHGTLGKVSLFTGNGVPLSFAGDRFDFRGAYVTAAWDSGQSAIVEGYRSGVLVYSRSIVTSPDQPYWWDFNFEDVDTVWFRPIPEPSWLVIDNITLGSAPYQVNGFLPPVLNQPEVNSGKAGRTYPLKWQLMGDAGVYVSDLDAVEELNAWVVECKTGERLEPFSPAAQGDAALRYDFDANQYIFNWRTPDLPGCYDFSVVFDSGQVLTAGFALR